ncbi:kinesin-like protein KIF24 [Anguilla rostrata]|uniref:kinesin-like protein KIF24 n=1 Tax=Anguilla rostrata TaxID=7938 RepID=UPI0030D2BE25
MLRRGPSVGRAAAERIRVCVRKRPLSRAEEKRGEADVAVVRNGESVRVHEQKEAVDLTQYVLQHEFYFDEVFSEACTNEDVYEKTAYPLIQHIFNGGKATCFAYGQTGAGKTHTMLGSSPRRPGLYALAARDIFARLAQAEQRPGPSPGPGPGPLSVRVSFFEIYCGQLYDLLDHRKRLFAREDGQRMVQIAGLREVGVESVASLLEVISRGSRERSRGASGVNCDSSRSHALLQIHLRACTHRLVGRISFVDLAGSERACDTRDPDRQSRMEGAEINQSLLALKECIRALDQELSHTPFRQSKLTQVLKDSFIGNSKTCMIANISPSHLATEHTLNTLRYADRVKELKKGGKSSHSHGGAWGKTLATPSPKRNKHLSRGKSPTKKVKLGVQRESRGAPSSVPAGVLFSPGANLLCSTPKTMGGARLEGGGAVGEVRLDHTTPLRGTLGRGRGRRDRGSERQSERREEEEDGGSNGGEARGQEARMWARPVWKETVPWETLRGHASSRRKEREREKEGERQETERERHLRRYHEHLQQFLPSAALLKTPRAPEPPADSLGPRGPRQPAPAGEEGASRGRPGPSHALELGHGSRSGPGERIPNAVDAELSRARGEMQETPPFGWGRGGDARELGRDGLALQGEGLGWGEGQLPGAGQGEEHDQEVGRQRRGLEGIVEGHRDRRTPVSPATGSDLGLWERWGVLGAGDEEEESWEGERETERGSDGPALLGWSSEEEDYSAYLSTESSSSNNNNNIPAERPLSPPRTSSALLAEDLNDLSHEFKCSNSQPRERLGPAWAGADPLRLHFDSLPSDSVNIALSASAPAVSTPLTGCSRRASGNPDSGEAPATSFALPGEAPAAVTSSTGAEPQDGTGPVPRGTAGAATPLGSAPPSRGSSPSAAESSTSTMDPLSISLLQVERQAATDSFLRPSSCSPCTSPEGDGGERGRAGEAHLLLEALLDIQTYWGNFESAVAPDDQRGQQSFDLNSALQCIKGMSATKDPSLSLTPFPGSFLETVAQPDSDILGLIKAAASPGGPNTQDPAGKTVSHASLSGQGQSEPSPTEAGPLKPTPVTEKSSGVQQEISGDSIRTEPKQGEVRDEQGLPLGRAELGRQDLPHKILPTGGLGKPHCTIQDPSCDSDPSVTSSYPQLASSTRPSSERLGPAQRLVVQAHCEQLEEMDSLCRREEALLSLQPSMDFTDYVLKLGEIMELKAKCVRSMRAQLQIYLTCSTDSHTLAH